MRKVLVQVFLYSFLVVLDWLVLGRFGGHIVTYTLLSLKFNKVIISLILCIILSLYHNILLKYRILNYLCISSAYQDQVNHSLKYLKPSQAGRLSLRMSVFVVVFILFVRYSEPCTDYLMLILHQMMASLPLHGRRRVQEDGRFIDRWIQM